MLKPAVTIMPKTSAGRLSSDIRSFTQPTAAVWLAKNREGAAGGGRFALLRREWSNFPHACAGIFDHCSLVFVGAAGGMGTPIPVKVAVVGGRQIHWLSVCVCVCVCIVHHHLYGADPDVGRTALIYRLVIGKWIFDIDVNGAENECESRF